MIPGPFDYHRPRSVDEVIGLLAQFGDDGRIIAGGHSLIPMMKLRLAVPGHLIDINGITDLAGIELRDGRVRLGALATQHDIIVSKLLAEKCPLLVSAALQIADPQVRYRGTIGGNVANGDPGNDMPAVMQCLDARYLVKGPKGERAISARDFYQAPYVTALDEGEILTGIEFVPPAAGHGHAYLKIKRKIGDYATAAVAVVLSLKAGAITQAAIALTNLGDTPLFAKAASGALSGRRPEAAVLDAAAASAASITQPASDLRGSADYRTHLAGVVTRRALDQALNAAQQG